MSASAMQEDETVHREAPSSAVGAETPAELQHRVEQFLFLEADLLDTRRGREWLELIDDDIVYEVGTSPTYDVYSAGSMPRSLVFEDDKESLTWRVSRAESGMAWAEEPPSRTRYLITNVRITPRADVIAVQSNFLLYRNRLETTAHFLVGSRKDVLRRASTEAGFTIARRVVTLDQNVVLANNLSMLF